MLCFREVAFEKRETFESTPYILERLLFEKHFLKSLLWMVVDIVVSDCMTQFGCKCRVRL